MDKGYDYQQPPRIPPPRGRGQPPGNFYNPADRYGYDMPPPHESYHYSLEEEKRRGGVMRGRGRIMGVPPGMSHGYPPYHPGPYYGQPYYNHPPGYYRDEEPPYYYGPPPRYNDRHESHHEDEGREQPTRGSRGRRPEPYKPVQAGGYEDQRRYNQDAPKQREDREH